MAAVVAFVERCPLAADRSASSYREATVQGEVDLAAFTAFYEECAHPLVYNGDLLTVEDIRKVDEEFPRLEGVMLGRGLLANPALAWEYANGTVFSR